MQYPIKGRGGDAEKPQKDFSDGSLKNLHNLARKLVENFQTFLAEGSVSFLIFIQILLAFFAPDIPLAIDCIAFFL